MPKPEIRREIRAFKGLEIREAKEGTVGTLTGYAALFDVRSEVMYDFVEVIKPGAFAKSLASGADVRALAHHSVDRIIGRRSANTLRISEDAKGLAVEIDLPDTTDGRDLAVSVRRGDLTGMSFGFQAIDDRWTWEQQDGAPKLYIRELLEVDLFEVSVVTWPAYAETTVEARSLLEAAKARISPAPTLAVRDSVIQKYRMIRDVYVS